MKGFSGPALFNIFLISCIHSCKQSKWIPVGGSIRGRFLSACLGRVRQARQYLQDLRDDVVLPVRTKGPEGPDTGEESGLGLEQKYRRCGEGLGLITTLDGEIRIKKWGQKDCEDCTPPPKHNEAPSPTNVSGQGCFFLASKRRPGCKIGHLDEFPSVARARA